MNQQPCGFQVFNIDSNLMPFAVWLLILFVFVAKFDSIVISMHLEEDEQCFSFFFFFAFHLYWKD